MRIQGVVGQRSQGCAGWDCAGPGVGLSQPCGSLLIQDIQRFCNSVKPFPFSSCCCYSQSQCGVSQVMSTTGTRGWLIWWGPSAAETPVGLEEQRDPSSTSASCLAPPWDGSWEGNRDCLKGKLRVGLYGIAPIKAWKFQSQGAPAPAHNSPYQPPPYPAQLTLQLSHFLCSHLLCDFSHNIFIPHVTILPGWHWPSPHLAPTPLIPQTSCLPKRSGNQGVDVLHALSSPRQAWEGFGSGSFLPNRCVAKEEELLFSYFVS